MNANLDLFLEQRNYSFPHLKRTGKELWELVLTPQDQRDVLVDKLCALMRSDVNFALSVANRCHHLGEPLNQTTTPKRLRQIFDVIDPFKLVAKLAPYNDVSQVMDAQLQTYYIRLSKRAADNAAALTETDPEHEIPCLFFGLSPALPFLTLAQLDPDRAGEVLAEDVERRCNERYGFTLAELTEAVEKCYAIPSISDTRYPATLRTNAVFRAEALRTKTRSQTVKRQLVA